MISRYTRPEMGKIWSEENKFRTWLRVELLACEAMRKLDLIPSRDLHNIKKNANFNVARILKIEESTNHDFIAFLTNVAEHVGASSRFIHKGLTSSDVVDTALSFQMVQAVDLLIRNVEKLRDTIADKAKKYKFTPMMGRTHGMHAEPITFGLKMALMYDEFGRALRRLKSARETIRVGQLSGAVGTYAHISPSIEKYVCKKLGLRAASISTQILQRDRHAEFITSLAIVGCSIERWAQEFRHLQRTEVREVEEFFGVDQKGSSAMPHKKNPVLAERLCGLARLLRGYSVTAMENVALWHERDISHSSAERVLVPDATILLDYLLGKFEFLVRTLTIFPQNMKRNMDLTQGLIFSQPLLLLLTEKGLRREEAYRLVQRNALKAWQKNQSFQKLILADTDLMKHVSTKEVSRVFDPKPHFKHVEKIFKAVGLS